MSFAPPPDYTKPLVAAVAGITIALSIFAVSQDHTPHVGDNIHSLPHGGYYQDGNKKIAYAGPNLRPNNSNTHHFWALITIFLVSALIVLSSRLQRNSHPVCVH
ncbi:ORF3 [Senna severe yellow mosaic virus]|uniref:ORF3 n=1 Tax=Senna severe yellow mosaic virus TaxID=742819 RepID=A0A5C1IT94_9VIRU|nr:ORF3 [Senna severe yellow mosaic virus]QEM20970.1 ORF3 [Senna severe yellow mosaic virus]